MVQPGPEKARGLLQSAWLLGRREPGSFYSVTPTDWAGGSGHKLRLRKFHVSTRKHFFYCAGCSWRPWISLLGDTSQPAWPHNLVLLVLPGVGGELLGCPHLGHAPLQWWSPHVSAPACLPKAGQSEWWCPPPCVCDSAGWHMFAASNWQLLQHGVAGQRARIALWGFVPLAPLPACLGVWQ